MKIQAFSDQQNNKRCYTYIVCFFFPMVHVVEGVLGFSDSGVGDECFLHGPTYCKQSRTRTTFESKGMCIHFYAEGIYICIYMSE